MSDEPHIRQGLVHEMPNEEWREWIKAIKEANPETEDVDIRFVIYVEKGTFLIGLDQLAVVNPHTPPVMLEKDKSDDKAT